MAKYQRKQLFVDPKVQGALILRVLAYWLGTVLTITAMAVCWRIMTEPLQMFATQLDDVWQQFAPAFVASIFLLPLMVVDCMRLSNRFTGPLYRLRRCLRELSVGKKVPNIHFRDGDFWQDVADEFNAVNARVQLLERELAEIMGSDEIPNSSDEIPVSSGVHAG